MSIYSYFKKGCPLETLNSKPSREWEQNFFSLVSTWLPGHCLCGYSWVSLEPFSVILSGGKLSNPKCIDDCTALEQANLTKLHTFAAKHKVNTFSEIFFSLMTVYRFGVNPQ